MIWLNVVFVTDNPKTKTCYFSECNQSSKKKHMTDIFAHSSCLIAYYRLLIMCKQYSSCLKTNYNKKLHVSHILSRCLKNDKRAVTKYNALISAKNHNNVPSVMQYMYYNTVWSYTHHQTSYQHTNQKGLHTKCNF